MCWYNFYALKVVQQLLLRKSRTLHEVFLLLATRGDPNPLIFSYPASESDLPREGGVVFLSLLLLKEYIVLYSNVSHPGLSGALLKFRAELAEYKKIKERNCLLSVEE